jgi:hypothetical protein
VAVYVDGLAIAMKNPNEFTDLLVSKQPCPMERGDHPELDESPELDSDGIRKYQSLIGALQWAVTLCRYDIHCAVMTIGRFRAAPRVGHLERLKRICGYLRNKKDAEIRFRTGRPNNIRTCCT